MKHEADRAVIKKMIRYCDDIGSLMNRFHSDFEIYKTDISFQYSCNMCIIQIGELVNRLSEDILESHAEIPGLSSKMCKFFKFFIGGIYMSPIVGLHNT